jgi:hypothetical protein
MLVTSDVFHPGMSVFPAAPQSAAFTAREQHASPEDTAARQLSTAVFRATESGNGEFVHEGRPLVGAVPEYAELPATQENARTKNKVAAGGITDEDARRRPRSRPFASVPALNASFPPRSTRPDRADL